MTNEIDSLQVRQRRFRKGRQKALFCGAIHHIYIVNPESAQQFQLFIWLLRRNLCTQPFPVWARTFMRRKWVCKVEGGAAVAVQVTKAASPLVTPYLLESLESPKVTGIQSDGAENDPGACTRARAKI
jgi:hypothetical protein